MMMGDRAFERGQWQEAVRAYDEAAGARATPAERARALTRAALACEHLNAMAGARERLERAVEPDVPGASEPALYHLAELVRAEDPARALNLYYRAAAGAEKHLHGAFPYRAATDRILQLSMSR
jgi:tetratricopeptide (TPR) repeat protein